MISTVLHAINISEVNYFVVNKTYRYILKDISILIFAPYSFQFSICSESQALNTSLIYFQYNSVNVNLKDPNKFITFMMFENTKCRNRHK